MIFPYFIYDLTKRNIRLRCNIFCNMNIARGHLDVIGQTFLCIEDVKPDEHTEVEE